MRRYSIMARETGHQNIIEVCQVDTNPEDLIAALKKKHFLGMNDDQKVKIPAYEHFEVRENAPFLQALEARVRQATA